MRSNPFAWIASDPYAYPALEVVHIAGIALLVGNLALLEVRVWGFGAALPLAPLARLALRLAWAGFSLIAASGVLMLAARPGDIITNLAFQVKLALMAAAGANALVFQRRGGLGRPDVLARLQSALSLGLWLAVIICGRWIAYR